MTDSPGGRRPSWIRCRDRARKFLAQARSDRVAVEDLGGHVRVSEGFRAKFYTAWSDVVRRPRGLTLKIRVSMMRPRHVRRAIIQADC